MITRRQSLKRLLGVAAATITVPTEPLQSSYAFRDKMDTDGVNHYKRVFDITDGLIRRGYSDADIELILGGNFSRVLQQIWTA